MDNTVATVGGNAELAQMYNESAKLGSENLGGSIPTLKVHTANKSVGNELIDGSEPKDGSFFLTMEQLEFVNPTVHILTISKGYYAPGMVDKKTGQKPKDQYNQLVGGVIMDGETPRPFVMYFTGAKLSRLWEFAKDINKYTHGKPLAIPMFALSVKLSTVKEKNAYGSSYVVNFEVEKNADGLPVLVTDTGKFVFLRDSVETLKETTDAMIKSKEIAPANNSGSEYEDIVIPDEESQIFNQ